MTARSARRRPLRGARLLAWASALAVVSACSGIASSSAPSPSTAAGASGTTVDAYSNCPTSQPAPLGASDTRTITINTSKGSIVVKVDGKLSPIATGNIVALAGCGYYDGVVFHRVVPSFVIQGGDGQYGRMPTINRDLVGTGGPGYTIKDEPVTSTYSRGTVAMARSGAPDSVGSQFFIVLTDEARQALAAPQYNNYQIVGSVTSGMEVADAIAAAADAEIPSQPIAMEKVTVATP
jgi:cyclophilin family peptidyl-prolyl cis-trans isomerase